jgi:hypothetical protein
MKAFGVTPMAVLICLAQGEDIDSIISASNHPNLDDFLDAVTDSESGAQSLEGWMEASGVGVEIAERVAFGLHGLCSEHCCHSVT